MNASSSSSRTAIGGDAPPVDRITPLALAAIVMVGLAIRLAHVNRPMHLDEAYTYNEYASRGLWTGITRYTLPNNHLLNTALVAITTTLLGPQRWAVRLPALLAGMALIPVAWLTARRFCDRRFALAAAALAAGSEPLIAYSTNARGYTMVALATLVLVLLGESIVRSGGSLREWLALALTAALGAWAIPIMLYPTAGVLVWMLCQRGARRGPGQTPFRLDRLAAACLLMACLTVLFHLPAVFTSGLPALVANPYVAPLSVRAAVSGLPGSLAAAWRQWNTDLPGFVTVLFAVAWAASLWPGKPDGKPSAGVLGILVVSVSVVVAIGQRVVPYERVWLFALPIYFVGIAAGVERIATIQGDWMHERARARVPVLAVALAVALAWLVHQGAGLPRERDEATLSEAAQVAQFLASRLGPETAIAAQSPCDGPLVFELMRLGFGRDVVYDYRLARARRIDAVVDQSTGQSLPGVLETCGVSSLDPDGLEPIARFGDAAVYELAGPRQ